MAFTESTDPQSHVLGGDLKSPESTEQLVALILDFLAAEVEPGPTP